MDCRGALRVPRCFLTHPLSLDSCSFKLSLRFKASASRASAEDILSIHRRPGRLWWRRHIPVYHDQFENGGDLHDRGQMTAEPKLGISRYYVDDLADPRFYLLKIYFSDALVDIGFGEDIRIAEFARVVAATAIPARSLSTHRGRTARRVNGWMSTGWRSWAGARRRRLRTASGSLIKPISTRQNKMPAPVDDGSYRSTRRNGGRKWMSSCWARAR